MGFEDAVATGVVGLDAGDAEAGSDGDALRGGVGLQGGVAVEQIHLAETNEDGIADNDGAAWADDDGAVGTQYQEAVRVDNEGVAGADDKGDASDGQGAKFCLAFK